jgi:hypothetical protein
VFERRTEENIVAYERGSDTMVDKITQGGASKFLLENHHRYNYIFKKDGTISTCHKQMVNHPHLAPRLRMSGNVPPLLHMPS